MGIILDTPLEALYNLKDAQEWLALLKTMRKKRNDAGWREDIDREIKFIEGRIAEIREKGET